MTQARQISERHLAWLADRGIDPEIATRFGLYSAKLATHGGEGFREPEPNPNGSILVYPYLDAFGSEENAKFRAPGKRFYQRPGAKKDFYNTGVIDDPDVQSGRQPLLIVEGENDCLIAVQDGHPWTVSCPDGAPPDKDNLGRPIPMKPDAELDPEHDAKFSFVFSNWERLKRVKRIVIATDSDGPGQRLRDELARRLGKVRCSFAEYPKDPVVPITDGFGMRPCKDLNEVHQFLGQSRVLETIQRAKPYPVSGLYTLDDYEARPDLTTYSTGFPCLDEHMKIYRGGFQVISGLPSHGKSCFVNQVAFNMAFRHDWHVTIASFESEIRPHIRDQLTGFFTEKTKSEWTYADRVEADAFIRKHFSFITDAPGKGNDNDSQATVEWLVDRAADAVIRHGTDMLVIDPWNELEHRRQPGEMRDEYTGRAIRLVKRFGREFDVFTAVVVHPTKEAGSKAMHGEKISAYDIADGAMWYNKSEQMVLVRKVGAPNEVGTSTTEVSISKIKFWTTGKEGDVLLPFNVPTRMFSAV